MRNAIIGLSILVTLLCGVLLFEKNREVAAIRARIAAAEQERDAIATEAAAAAKRNQRLQTRLSESRAEALDKTVKAEELQQQLANTQARAKAHKGVSDILRGEMMKEVLKAEAKQGTARNINALFDAGLAEQLHLNEDQSAALKQLLGQRMSILWDQMFVPMATGELDEAGMAQTGKAIKQAIGENSAQIRALLGDDGYNAYRWFDQTQPERSLVTKFSSQAGQAGQELSAEQQSQLLAVMTDERTNFRSQNDFGDPEKLDFEHWNENFTDEKIDAFAQGMEQSNERIVQRAQTVLTPEQTAQLRQALAQELFRGLVVMRSTTAMMSGNAP